LLGAGLCDCPNCRRARGEAVSPFEDFEEDDDEVDLDEALDNMPLPPGVTPEMARMLVQEAVKSVERGESMDAMLNRVFGSAPGGRKRKKGGRR